MNVATGYKSLENNTTGSSNIASGYQALASNTTAANNVGIGTWALVYNVTGEHNTAIGNYALRDSGKVQTAGTFVTGVTYTIQTTGTTDFTACGAANSNVGTVFTATGAGSGTGTASPNTDSNVAVGRDALVANTSGAANVACGRAALSYNTTGDQNTAVGLQSLDRNTTGTKNTGCGTHSLRYHQTGDQCVGVGDHSLYNLTSGSNVIGIGFESGTASSPSGALTDESNIVCIGDDNITAAHVEVSWSIGSDERDKTDFTALDLGLDFVNDLKPVTYKWDKRSKYGDKDADDYDLAAQTPDGTHKEDWLDIGFKAQEVEALEIAAGYNKSNKTNLIASQTEDGKRMTLQYNKFIPVLVKAVQELSAENEALLTRIEALENA